MSSTPLDTYKQAEEKRRLERETAEQNSLFREVEDDLRHDMLHSLWKRFGVWIIAAAVLIVVGVAGYQIHKSMQESERAEQAAQLDAADDAARLGHPEKAIELLTALEAKANPGYRTLARLRHASLLIDGGKSAEARPLLKAISADDKALRAYRDLAVILDALCGLDTDDPKAIRDALAPLTDAGQPWRHTALELSALAQARGGDAKGATETLKSILDDPDVPQDQRAIVDSLRTVFARDAKTAK